VRFNPEEEQTYPVNCDRADIQPGTVVIVQTPDQEKKFKKARVENIEFKNWNCKNSIVGCYSELEIAPDRSWAFNTDYLTNGQIHHLRDLQLRLRDTGWTGEKPRQSTWKIIYRLRIGEGSASIAFRKNGIDIGADGKGAQHWYFDSEVDLCDLCWRFAESWRNQSGEYDEFFKPRGRKFTKPQGARSDLGDIYDAISGGTGGAAYLGDGTWLGSGGRSWDEHR
jgi:hypothetical protein